ncbi:MAG: hypothetical protein JSW73_03520 [Candidatus Woesearchaeota archaeon]|nr:MAG: hypothetical protein JSW73_03520 [Candidatus Woesearchaeota archaeon]
MILRLTAALALGFILFLVCLLIAVVAFPILVILLPFLAILTFGVLAILVAAFVLWLILYLLIMIGVGFYYFIKKPMRVSKKKGKYSIGKVEESGRRSEG